MLRAALLTASRNKTVRRMVETAPVSRDVVRRFVAGNATDDAVRVSAELAGEGMFVSLDHLGEDTTETGHADATTKAYVTLLGRLGDSDLADRAEVSVKLSAVGQALDESMARDNAAAICAAAAAVGTTVTLDMEDHTTTDSTLGILRDLRGDYPWVGAVLQAYLHRTESDCRDLAYAGSRVRLCKGAYKEPASVAFQSRLEVDKSYVRCLSVLMDGAGYPMVATHDPRLIAIARSRAAAPDAPRAATSSRCSTASAPTSSAGSPRQARRCASTCPMATSGTATSCAGWPNGRANVAFFLRALATKAELTATFSALSGTHNAENVAVNVGGVGR